MLIEKLLKRKLIQIEPSSKFYQTVQQLILSTLQI